MADNKLTVEHIREMVKALRENARPMVDGNYHFPMRADIRLTVDGVVVIPGVGWMHPYTFKHYAGEEAYQWLLAQPRIPSLYPEDEDGERSD